MSSGWQGHRNLVAVALEHWAKLAVGRDDVQCAQTIGLGVGGAVRLDAFFEVARHIDQPAPGGDHGYVRRAQTLLGAIADETHALGHGAVLGRNAADAGEAFGALLVALDEVVVALILVEQPGVNRQAVVEPELAIRARPWSDAFAGLQPPAHAFHRALAVVGEAHTEAVVVVDGHRVRTRLRPRKRRDQDVRLPQHLGHPPVVATVGHGASTAVGEARVVVEQHPAERLIDPTDVAPYALILR